MALLNHAKKELSAKIVYYGPGLSGKTTNLEWIHRKWEPDKRGKLISLETKTDRTLFFDFLPVQIGEIAGYRTRFNVYTVPGQIFYNETRKMVLKGVDGVVFVADSQKEMASENVENLKNLAENLRSIGKDLHKIPMVIQYNKRDLANTLTVEELNRLINQDGIPFFEAIAVQGEGVLTTLTRVTRMVADHLKNTLFMERKPLEQEPLESPSQASNVRPFPLRPSSPPAAVPQAEDVPAFLSARPSSPGPVPVPAPSAAPDFGISPNSDTSLSNEPSKPEPSPPRNISNVFSQDAHDLGEPDPQTLNEPLMDLTPSLGEHPEDETSTVPLEQAGYDVPSVSMEAPGTFQDPQPETAPSGTFQASGPGMALAEAEPEEAPEAYQESVQDPSLIAPTLSITKEQGAGAFSVLLGSPEREASNEIRIPLSIRKDDSGERFSFHVSIRIDTNNRDG